MENILRPQEFDLHIQKSFSFTAFSKFKDSSLEFFSDDDEEEENQNDPNNPKNDFDNINNNNNNNSYIEISLDHNPNNNSFDNHLRISFSSSFPSIPESQTQNPVAGPSSSPSSMLSTSSSVRLSASSLRSSSTGTCRGPVLGSESFNHYDGSRRRDQLPVFNPLVHTLLFSLETHPSPAPVTVDHIDRRDLNGGDRREWKGIINHDRPNLQLAVTNNVVHANTHRKSSIIKTTTTGSTSTGNQSGIMNKLLMIKLRATKVKKLFYSLFTKSRGPVNICNPNNVENDISHGKRPKRQYNPTNDTNYDDKSSNTNDTKPRALEVNLGAVRGVLEAMNNMGSSNNKRNNRTNRRKTSSCPSSIKSSPIHQGFGGECNNNEALFGAENSIQAAIAHCKSSLGQSTDFRL